MKSLPLLLDGRAAVAYRPGAPHPALDDGVLPERHVSDDRFKAELDLQALGEVLTEEVKGHHLLRGREAPSGG